MKLEEARKSRLKKEFHWYVVYMPDDTERFLQGRTHCDAELRAAKQYPGNFGVAYTEI